MNQDTLFCLKCTHKMGFSVPKHEDTPRWWCNQCGYIHYVNPNIVTGTLPIFNNKILLCKRAIEPRKGWWTLPGGFMETGESLEQAAMRETYEEARANVRLQGLLTVQSAVHIQQVHLFFLAEILNQDFHPGPETEAIQLTTYEDLNWDSLAFPTVKFTLESLQSRLNQKRLTLADIDQLVEAPLVTQVSTLKPEDQIA